MYGNINTIVGGIDVKSDSVIKGGIEIIVGENVKWMIRNKFLTFNNEISYDLNTRRLLKIIGLKLPIMLDNDILYYNDEKVPVLNKDEINNKINIRSIALLKERIKFDSNTVIEKLIQEYELRDIFYSIIYDIIRCLAYVHKKNKPSSYRIKINAALASELSNKFRDSYYFTYSINSKINNVKSLLNYMIDIVCELDTVDKKIDDPCITNIEYPLFTKTEEYEKMKISEIEKLSKITDIEELIKAYTFSILNLENLLTDYLDEIERYYITCSKNMSIILDILHSRFDIELIQ